MLAANRVTILIPTYEPKPDQLKKAIETVLSQTCTEWELFIQDDASQANVFEMVAPYLEDQRITFRRSEERMGLAGNWNVCSKLGDSEYVQFLFQDDWWEPNYLSTAIEALDLFPNAGFVTMRHRYACEDTPANIQQSYQSVLDYRSKWLHEGLINGKKFLPFWMSNLMRKNVIGEPSFVMMKRSLMDRLGKFRDDLPQCVDVEYWVRAMQQKDFVVCEKDVGAFRVHAGAESARNRKRMRGKTDLIKILLMYCLADPVLLFQVIKARFTGKQEY